MELFGIGPMELLFIFLLVLIIFGPKDIQKAGKTLGRELNKLVKSDTWKTINQASQRIRTLPNELMREAGLEELQNQGKAIQAQANDILKGTMDHLSDRTGDPNSSDNPPSQVSQIMPNTSVTDEPAEPSTSNDPPQK